MKIQEVKVYTRLKADKWRYKDATEKLEPTYPADVRYILGWGGKKPVTLPAGTSLGDAFLAAKKKEVELMMQAPKPVVVAAKGSRLELKAATDIWIERWGARRKPNGMKLADSSLNKYRRSANTFLESCETQFLDEIDLSDLETLRDDMEDEHEPGGIKTVLWDVQVFLHSFDCTEYPNLLMKDPQNEHKQVPIKLRYVVDEAEVTSYSVAEYDALYAASTPEERLRWATLRGVGYRKNELSHAEYSDFRGNAVSIKAKPHYNWKPKSKLGTRIVTASDWLVEEVKRWHHAHPNDRLLFPGPDGKPETGSKLLYRLKTRAWKAGLNCGLCESMRYDGKTVSCREAPVCRHWKLHRFRATFATDLYLSGKFTELDIMALLGHCDFKITQKYLRLAKANSDTMREKMNGIWLPPAVDNLVVMGA